MKPEEREDNLYRNGKRCQISLEEEALFEFFDNNSSAGSKVLDIGCGSGEIAHVINEKGHLVSGIDFSPIAIELARKQGIDCQVVDLDSGIPFDDNTFNTVWAGDIIEHVFDPIFVLNEIKRVLIPGGQLLCTVPYDLNIATRLRIFLGHSYQENVYREYGQYKHHTFFSMSLMKYMLNEAGFEPQDIKYLIRIPKTQIQYVTKSRAMVYLANTMIIRATVKK
ncbi:MAG: class I SAM-dependent methyltransferase [Planctomycetota bacterium]|jgi:SAM-dependent methyltransferase